MLHPSYFTKYILSKILRMSNLVHQHIDILNRELNTALSVLYSLMQYHDIFELKNISEYQEKYCEKVNGNLMFWGTFDECLTSTLFMYIRRIHDDQVHPNARTFIRIMKVISLHFLNHH